MQLGCMLSFLILSGLARLFLVHITVFPFMHHKYLPIFILSALLCSCHSHKEDQEHEDEHHNISGIHLEPEMAAQFGIEYETVKKTDFQDAIKTSGEIEVSTEDLVTLSAKKSGIISFRPGIVTGTSIKKGETLATISAEGIQGGDINKAATETLKVAKAEYERLKPLFEEGLVTASSLREAEKAFREAEALAGSATSGVSSSVTSPFDGTIRSLKVSNGEYVDAGTAIALVGKNVNLILKADLPAREAKHSAEIEKANFIPASGTNLINTDDLGGKKLSVGTESAVNGYIPVYFSFSGDPANFPAGYAEIYLICGNRPDVISVPRTALLEIQGNRYVYVYNGYESYEKRLVKTGASDGERVEIIEGINEGEQVVAKGASVIRMAEMSAITPPSHNHSH